MPYQSKNLVGIKPVVFRFEHDSDVKNRITVSVFAFFDKQINYLRRRKMFFKNLPHNCVAIEILCHAM